MMNNYVNLKNTKLLCFGLDTAFLLIHIAMILLFLHYGVTPMFAYNVFSILFYLGMPFLINRDRLTLFMRLTYAEVATHMALAAYFVGWEGSFQVTLIGVNAILFYMEYAVHLLKLPRMRALWPALFSMALYTALCFIDHYHEPPYPLPAETTFHLQIAWGLIVFIVSVAFLKLFVVLAAKSQEQLAEEAKHDSLTGLPNRYYMTDYLDKVINRMDADRYWLAIADLDDFKRVNDVYGHNCGDYVLKTLAELAREGGVGAEVCRWGGEEFLLAGRMEYTMAEVVSQLNRLRRRVEAHAFLYEGQALNLTVTIGASAYHANDTMESWVNRADMKLYEGKTGGKNRVVA